MLAGGLLTPLLCSVAQHDGFGCALHLNPACLLEKVDKGLVVRIMDLLQRSPIYCWMTNRGASRLHASRHFGGAS
jgi:hypothetical protein